jgi:hypothetical protein
MGRKSMEYVAYAFIGLAAFVWFLLMLFGMIMAFPFGILGLIAILGIGILLVKVLFERFSNKEDDYYEKNVDK